MGSHKVVEKLKDVPSEPERYLPQDILTDLAKPCGDCWIAKRRASNIKYTRKLSIRQFIWKKFGGRDYDSKLFKLTVTCGNMSRCIHPQHLALCTASYAAAKAYTVGNPNHWNYSNLMPSRRVPKVRTWQLGDKTVTGCKGCGRVVEFTGSEMCEECCKH